jgi:hypothetical protein
MVLLELPYMAAGAGADGEEKEQGPKRRHAVPVPAWLQKLAGMRISFDRFREVIEVLHDETGKSKTAKFPDIVFFPVLK